MNEETQAAILLGVTALSFYGMYKSLKKIKLEEEEKRRKIAEETSEYLSNLKLAEGKIRERIATGKYDGKPVNVLLNDLRFETIVANLEEK